ncbi:MAG: DUF3857 domain-containing protein [Chitinophagaceae bacterium]|nr:DUF3857 domain-containing protein [Chitinophagaceae bacterium]
MTVRKKLVPVLCCLMAGPFFLNAQDKIHFGKISPADFEVKAPSFDPAADAVVIADVGSSEFVGNNKGWFTLDFKHFKRVKILNKKGFEAANEEILLYTDGETVDGLKAATYNLEGGKVVETRLDDKSVFTDKLNKYLSVKKFTFPALKEGSIIEFTYTEHSQYLRNLQPWAFQGEYPSLYSEYQVSIPNFFQYVTLSQGFLPFDVKTDYPRHVNFRVTIPGGADRDETVNFDDDVVDHKWAMKNVPSLKPERYTTTVNNYISKIEFQLARYAFPHSMTKDMMGNWLTVSQGLMKLEDFGADLHSNNGWMDEVIKTITRGAVSPTDKAKKIYTYVRDNYTCTDHSSLYCTGPIKTVFKNRNGNEAEINLLLVAMLNHEHLMADPVILSTRSHGFTNELYPLLSRFNYVVGRVVIDSSVLYLDASEPWIGFGHLPERCYNGHARVITREMPLPVYFDADSIMEKKLTTVFVSNVGKGVIDARVQSVPGYFESCNIREKIHDKSEKDFFKTIQTAYQGEPEIANVSIDSLTLTDQPVGVNYDVMLKNDTNEEVIYFNPMLEEGYKENPFKAADRKYPVEMPYGFDETYILNMEIPEGYVVDEIPKSTKVTFNEDEGFFEYLIVKDDSNIQFRSRVVLKKANFRPEDYATLRDFFAFVVKKQGEQIVFKKKK